MNIRQPTIQRLGIRCCLPNDNELVAFVRWRVLIKWKFLAICYQDNRNASGCWNSMQILKILCSLVTIEFRDILWLGRHKLIWGNENLPATDKHIYLFFCTWDWRMGIIKCEFLAIYYQDNRNRNGCWNSIYRSWKFCALWLRISWYFLIRVA